jgi:hypothetical protein
MGGATVQEDDECHYAYRHSEGEDGCLSFPCLCHYIVCHIIGCVVVIVWQTVEEEQALADAVVTTTILLAVVEGETR